MPRKIIPYEPYLKELARKLRNDSSISEIKLWSELKGKQMLGYDFHRQKPLLKYIVDFYCNELMLAIEIDGISHWEDKAVKKDNERQAELEKLGITFLRFAEEDVKKDLAGVVQTIEFWIQNETERNKP